VSDPSDGHLRPESAIRCEVRSLARVTYENGLRLQEAFVSMRQRHELPDQLLLLEHPSVITLGRGGNPSNLLVTPESLRKRRIRFFETARGGDITWHGPGQVVGYPILHLGEGSRDVRKYVTRLEEVLLRTVADFGISAHRIDGRHGIWAGNEKLASIGVRIAKWVTSHGFALNVAPDLTPFEMITACGLRGAGVTSMSRLTEHTPGTDVIKAAIVRHFGDVFDREMEQVRETIHLVKILVHDGDHILLFHRKPKRGNFWQPITGTMQEGESPFSAAKRELLEETGNSIQPIPLELTQSFLIESAYLAERFESPIIASEVLYAGQLTRDARIDLDEEEHDDFGWFTLPEAHEKIRWTDDRDALEHFEKLKDGDLERSSDEYESLRVR